MGGPLHVRVGRKGWQEAQLVECCGVLGMLSALMGRRTLKLR